MGKMAIRATQNYQTDLLGMQTKQVMFPVGEVGDYLQRFDVCEIKKKVVEKYIHANLNLFRKKWQSKQVSFFFCRTR